MARCFVTFFTTSLHILTGPLPFLQGLPHLVPVILDLLPSRSDARATCGSHPETLAPPLPWPWALPFPARPPRWECAIRNGVRTSLPCLQTKRDSERRTLVSFGALPEGAGSLSGVAGASPSSSRLPPLPRLALIRPSIPIPLRPQAPSCSPTTLRVLQYSHPDPAMHPLKTPSTSPSPSPSLQSPLPPRLLPDLRPG